MGRILCHPDAGKSCGACCGMYNHREFDEEATTARILARTLAYRREARIEEPSSLQVFREKYEDREDSKLLGELQSCPFLGFVTVQKAGDKPGKVGCLVHPLQNDGLDGRDCGVFDRFICEDYLCAAHKVLREREMDLVIGSVEDSYLYGLVITNPGYVRGILAEVARRLGEEPSIKVIERHSFRRAAGACFELLRAWPYRAEDGIFGRVRVTGSQATQRRRVPEIRDREVDQVDGLLLDLGTSSEEREVWERARQRLLKVLDALVEAAK